MIGTRHSAIAASIARALAPIPEVKRACEWAVRDPDGFGEILDGYFAAIVSLAGYSRSDLDLIALANRTIEEASDRPKSASRLHAGVLFEALGERRWRLIPEVVRGGLGSEFLDRSLSQLSSWMRAGHELFSGGATPADGDPASDGVIWGHTQARSDVRPEIMLHFVVSHLLDRLAAHCYDDVALLQGKDSFLAVLTDGLLLDHARDPRPCEILIAWSTPREAGGLGWITDEQVTVFRRAHAHTLER